MNSKKKRSRPNDFSIFLQIEDKFLRAKLGSKDALKH